MLKNKVKSPNWCSNCKKETDWLIVPFQPSLVQCKECGHLKKFPDLKVEKPEVENTHAIEQEISDYEKSIERLTILFSRGEISEESYKKAVQTIEKSIKKLHKKTIECPKCGKEVPKDFKLCPHCGFDWRATSLYHPSYTPHVEKPSSWWYLVPLLLGLIGGLIGYIAVKDEDKKMAETLLWVGIIISVISILVTWAIYSYYISLISRLY